MIIKTHSAARIVASLCLAAPLVAGAAPTGPSDPTARITTAAANRKATLAATASQLEARSAALQQRSPSPQEAGRMYLAVEQAYVQTGSEGLAKVAEYCQKALDCPQDLLTQIQLHVDWADAILNSPAADPVAAATQRQQAATKYLQALNLVIANQTARKPQPLPAVRAIPAAASQEASRLTAQAARQQDQHARKAVQHENALINWRQCLVEMVAAAYTNVPDGREELTQLAASCLASAEGIQEILAAFDKIAVQTAPVTP